jgi:glycosyltransferase involved in cell wall biosynthesis
VLVQTAPTLSVVVPMLNEEGNLDALYTRLCASLAGEAFELVFVDDGSTDQTPAMLAALAERDPRVKVLELSRNFGHQPALSAGLDHARGQAVVMLDADLQDPPELIPTLLTKWREGVEVVYAVRENRVGESRAKLLTADLFYRVIQAMAQLELPRNAGDFRLLDRRALDALLSMRERNRYLRGMTVWVGYTQAAVPYEREARATGNTKFTPGRMLRFSLDAIASFSHVPLQIATLVGVALATVALALVPLTVVARLSGLYQRGVPTLLAVILLLGGFQLMTLGVIGEYIGRIYDEVKQRPLYLVRRTHNLEEPEP